MNIVNIIVINLSFVIGDLDFAVHVKGEKQMITTSALLNIKCSQVVPRPLIPWLPNIKWSIWAKLYQIQTSIYYGKSIINGKMNILSFD